MSQPLETRYNNLKDGFRATYQKKEKMLREQEIITNQHFEKSTKNLEEQCHRTKQQKNVRQQMLMQHHEDQKQLMQQRHNEILSVRTRLGEIKKTEQTQSRKEQEIHRDLQTMKQREHDLNLQRERILTERDLLEQQKELMLQEMEQFEDINSTMNHLNLWSCTLTEEQITEIDHPEIRDSYSVYGVNRYHQSHDVHFDRVDLPSESSLIFDDSAPRVRKSETEETSTRLNAVRSEKQKITRMETESEDFDGAMYLERRDVIAQQVSGQDATVNLTPSNALKSLKKRSGTGHLYIRLVDARDVFGPDGSLPNTYVQLEIDGDVQKSTTKTLSCNPKWNEVFKFKVKDYETSELKLELIHSNDDQVLAKMAIPCKHFMQE